MVVYSCKTIPLERVRNLVKLYYRAVFSLCRTEMRFYYALCCCVKEYDGMKADVWSLGVILYVLVTGGFPFPSHSLDKLKRAVLAGQLKIPYWVSVGKHLFLLLFPIYSKNALITLFIRTCDGVK